MLSGKAELFINGESLGEIGNMPTFVDIELEEPRACSRQPLPEVSFFIGNEHFSGLQRLRIMCWQAAFLQRVKRIVAKRRGKSV